MMIERWALIRDDVLPTLRSQLKRIQPRERFSIVDAGWTLCEITVHRQKLRALQARVGVKLSPSLTAPATNLPQALLDVMADEGVTIATGDDVQTALRKLRNARGHQDDYDIDKPF